MGFDLCFKCSAGARRRTAIARVSQTTWENLWTLDFSFRCEYRHDVKSIVQVEGVEACLPCASGSFEPIPEALGVWDVGVMSSPIQG